MPTRGRGEGFEVGKRYDPWAHANELEVEVVHGRLHRNWRGAYDHIGRRIILAKGMSFREERSTLAHEVQHALAGDMASPFGLLTLRQELLARRGAAQMLICPAEYADAEETRGGYLQAIAHELEVTIRIITDWRIMASTAVAL